MAAMGVKWTILDVHSESIFCPFDLGIGNMLLC